MARRRNKYAVALGFSPVHATRSGAGRHGQRHPHRAERRNLRDFLNDELTEYHEDNPRPKGDDHE